MGLEILNCNDSICLHFHYCFIYCLIADQTPVVSCWAPSITLALAFFQRLSSTPCPPIKRISFAFWASMERIINDRQTILHQVNIVSKNRVLHRHISLSIYLYKHMHPLSYASGCIVFVIVRSNIQCIYIYRYNIENVWCTTHMTEWCSLYGDMCCQWVLAQAIAIFDLLGLKTQFSILPFYRFIDNAKIGWQSKCIRSIHSVNVYYGHLFIHCDIPLNLEPMPKTTTKIHVKTEWLKTGWSKENERKRKSDGERWEEYWFSGAERTNVDRWELI